MYRVAPPQTKILATPLDRFSLGSRQGSRAAATDVAHLPAAARNIRGSGEGVHPETTFMQSPDGKSEWHCGDDGGKCVGSSGNDEETEDGSTV